jgi:hypothetical protein
MVEKLTASQLNRLGDRLRKGQANDNDIRALHEFRESFRPAFDRVVGELESLGLAVGGRAAKTIGSIVAKLEREKTRLSTMQDIAGCRVEVADRIEQDSVVEQIIKVFPNSKTAAPDQVTTIEQCMSLSRSTDIRWKCRFALLSRIPGHSW